MNNSDSSSLLSDKYPIAKRLTGIEPSRLKAALGQSHEDVIDLASGAPFFNAPDSLISGAIRAISDNHNQSGNTFGDLCLRQEIASMYSQSLDREIDGDSEITVTAGTSSALNAIVLATINPGDQVIVFEPYYESYITAIKLAGGKPKIVPLNPEDWSISVEKVERAFTKKTKMVIVNTPHNPTGKIFGSHSLAYLLELCEEYGAILLSDEIYSNLLLSGSKHVSPLSCGDVDPNRVIVVDGLSKAHNVSGWRIGYVLASRAYTEAIRIVHSTLGLSAPTPLQVAAREAFRPVKLNKSLTDPIPGSEAYNNRNLNLLFDAITKAGMKAVKPEGANFIFADASNLVDGETSARDALLEKTGILTISGDGFFHESSNSQGHFLRFCFARDSRTIEEAVKRLERLS